MLLFIMCKPNKDTKILPWFVLRSFPVSHSVSVGITSFSKTFSVVTFSALARFVQCHANKIWKGLWHGGPCGQMVGPAQTYKEKPRQSGWIIIPPTVPLCMPSEFNSLTLCFYCPTQNVVWWWIICTATSCWSGAYPWGGTAGLHYVWSVWDLKKLGPMFFKQ